jgi:two-component system chemotaxis response regulator CheB
MTSHPIRVLIIDDSALVREVLSKGLSKDPGIEVVGVAPDPYIARDKIVQLRPDVLTLDVEMPRMDGVEFLRRLMPQYPLPVVMVSSMTEKGKKVTLDALDAGAVDFVSKPRSDMASGLNGMMTELCTKIKIASTANVSHWKHRRAANSAAPIQSKLLTETSDAVIAIGASTGGTEAIRQVITQFPPTTPGVVIVQHMPPGFTRMFADRMNDLSMMEVKEARDGDRVMPGRVLIAPGDKHLKVSRSGGLYQVECKSGAAVCGHCPSVEVLMQSVAKYAGINAVGVMLTGMGSDGADGMRAIRDAGGRTIAQDEASSVVFGMPKAAYLKGGVESLVPISKIAQMVLNLIIKKSGG